MILKTLDNAIHVLNCFTEEKNYWGVRELARELNTSHAAINRILKTYEKNGFLIQNHETKKYYLGFKFIEFSQIVKGQFSISEQIYPIMQRISEQTKESIFLTWKENNEGVTLAIAESTESIKYSVSIGTRTPLHVGASCKVMLAYLPKDEQQEIIENGLGKFHKYVQKRNQLINELDDIKNKKWSFTHSEYTDQVFGLSVPIFDENKKIIASITIAGPLYRLTENKKQDMLKLLIKEAKIVQLIIEN